MSDTYKDRRKSLGESIPRMRPVVAKVSDHLIRSGDCWYAGMSHMELFHELIKRGPTMHGTPGKPKGKS